MYCPECHAEIDELIYSANYTEWGREYGTADLNGDIIDTDNRDCDDSETIDIEYECPECNSCISPDEILDELPDDEDDQDEEDNPKVKCIKNILKNI